MLSSQPSPHLAYFLGIRSENLNSPKVSRKKKKRVDFTAPQSWMAVGEVLVTTGLSQVTKQEQRIFPTDTKALRQTKDLL